MFEYVCRDCQQRFETLVTASRQPACPACRSQALDKQFSVFAVAVGEPKARARSAAPAPCGSCGDPRGAGSCGLN